MLLAKIIYDMNPITMGFIGVIVLFALYFHLTYTSATIHKAPAILTTLGILGTFVGIAIGLANFDSNDVHKSVPALIDGMKTAFWASACGIFWAITIKVRDAMFDGRKSITDKKSTGANINDLASLLKAVQQALVGNDESTLIGQIRLARQDSNDRMDKLSRATDEAHKDSNTRLDALTRSLDEFGRTVAENNSKVLIEALKDVIREFNEKITEQFGENFKQLNHAVGQLLVWQEQYRQQMAEMIEQQQATSKNMAVATEKYQVLVGHAEAFNTIAGNMAALINALDTQRAQIDESLRSLATLINTASKGLPEIENKIIEMVRQVSNGVKATNDEFKGVLLSAVNQTAKQVGDTVKIAGDGVKAASDGVKAANEELKVVLLNTVSQMTKQIGDSVKATNDEVKTGLLKVVQESNREFNNNIEQIIKKTREQVGVLDQALSEELTKSLESLGRQLAAVSQRFAEDYTPLADRLRTALEIAR